MFGRRRADSDEQLSPILRPELAGKAVERASASCGPGCGPSNVVGSSGFRGQPVIASVVVAPLEVCRVTQGHDAENNFNDVLRSRDEAMKGSDGSGILIEHRSGTRVFDPLGGGVCVLGLNVSSSYRARRAASRIQPLVAARRAVMGR